MPLYAFRSADGHEIERFYRMDHAKPTSIHIEGTEYHRVYGNVQVQDMAHVKYPYQSKRLVGTVGTAEAEYKPLTIAGHTMMAPVIESKSHEDRIAKTHGLVRE